jgi:hypothetical protein
MLSSSFGFLDGNDPANPLVASERGKVFPYKQSFGIGAQGLSQVCRQSVRHSAGNFPRHMWNISRLTKRKWPFLENPRTAAGPRIAYLNTSSAESTQSRRSGFLPSMISKSSEAALAPISFRGCLMREMGRPR